MGTETRVKPLNKVTEVYGGPTAMKDRNGNVQWARGQSVPYDAGTFAELLYCGVSQKWVAEELARLTGAEVWLDGRNWCVVRKYTKAQQDALETQFLIDNCMED